jgi:hypothetical protein
MKVVVVVVAAVVGGIVVTFSNTCFEYDWVSFLLRWRSAAAK